MVEEDAIAYLHGFDMIDASTGQAFTEYAFRLGETGDWPGLAGAACKAESGANCCCGCKAYARGCTKRRLGILDYTGAADDFAPWTHATYVAAGQLAEAAWEEEQRKMRVWMRWKQAVDPAKNYKGWTVERRMTAVEGIRRVPAAAKLSGVYSGSYDVVNRTWHDFMHVVGNTVGRHAWELAGTPEAKMCKRHPRPTKQTVLQSTAAGNPLAPLQVPAHTSRFGAYHPPLTYFGFYSLFNGHLSLNYSFYSLLLSHAPPPSCNHSASPEGTPTAVGRSVKTDDASELGALSWCG
jgi:hypothetical protein